MSDEDQFWSARAAAYTGVLHAAASLTGGQATQGSPAAALLELTKAVEAARLYAPEPTEEVLLALEQAAQRWERIAATNDPRSRTVAEAATALEQQVSLIRTLMRDDLRPAPSANYADDSTLLARMRIAYAREKPLAQREKALTVGWPPILFSALFDLVFSVLWWALWFKTAVWLIGTYWWTGMPMIGWLPAVGLAVALKFWQLKWNGPWVPFPLPVAGSPAGDRKVPSITRSEPTP